MGFWGDVLGIGGDIAGAFVGMPWIGSAATAVGNAITGSDAATSAARTQQQGAQQAAALEQPAITIGQGALRSLGSLYGLATGPNIGGALQAVTTGIPAARAGVPTLPQNGIPGMTPSGLQGPEWQPPPKFANGVDPNSLYGMAQPANASSYGA